MDDKKAVEGLQELIAAGDAWLRKYGVVSSVAHNSIVLNLYVAFPRVRYVEYFLPEDTSRRKVWVILYVPLWRLLLTKRDKLVDDVIMFLREYLDGYDIQVELKRYKRGVERSDEIPTDAINHVGDAAAPDEHAKPDADSGGGAGDPGEPGDPAPVSDDPSQGGGEAGGADRGGV